MIEHLSSFESAHVLRSLLKRHQNLVKEAEEIAADLVSEVAAEDGADEVYDAVTSIGLDDLNDRAGSHSWGYVEPSEAACELLEESVEDVMDRMKRALELGQLDAAINTCLGIVTGLYRAKGVKSDDVLGWDPDFSANHACYTVEVFMRSCPEQLRQKTRIRLGETLQEQCPQWTGILERAAVEK